MCAISSQRKSPVAIWQYGEHFSNDCLRIDHKDSHLSISEYNLFGGLLLCMAKGAVS